MLQLYNHAWKVLVQNALSICTEQKQSLCVSAPEDAKLKVKSLRHFEIKSENVEKADVAKTGSLSAPSVDGATHV